MTTIVLTLCLLLLGPWGALAQSAPEVLERVLPAVVTVAIYKAQRTMMPFGYAAKPTDIAYQRALDLAGSRSVGSGFAITHDGKKYVVTNAHVVQNAVTEEGAIVVYGIDGAKYPVRIVGGDSLFDIAVLGFDADEPGEDLGVLTFRDQTARIGERVYAIGNPFGDFPYTVTEGIISGKNRTLGGLTAKYGYLQSTAFVSPGNSGGPLVDAQGHVIGVNTAVGQRGGVQQPQLNFALEVPLAQRVVGDILAHGRVRRAFLGVMVAQSYTSTCQAEQCHWSVAEPVPSIAAVLPQSPAADALAGKEGARIVAINAIPVRTVDEALGELEKLRPGDRVAFEVDLQGTRESVTLPTQELTGAQLGTMAAYLLSCYGLTAGPLEGGGIALRQQRGPRPSSPMSCGRQAVFIEQASATTPTKIKPQAAATDELSLLAAGLVDTEGSGPVWRVTHSADLGVAVRLAAMGGHVDFIGKERGTVVARRLWLSGRQDMLTKILLY